MASINIINVDLTVIVSLRVPPFIAYNISNLGVILLLFYLDPCLSSFNSLPLSYPNVTTASLLFIHFRRYSKIRKLSGSHDFMNHILKLGSYASIFMRIRNIKNSSWGNYRSHNFSANTNYQLTYTKRILYNIPIRERYF